MPKTLLRRINNAAIIFAFMLACGFQAQLGAQDAPASQARSEYIREKEFDAGFKQVWLATKESLDKDVIPEFYKKIPGAQSSIVADEESGLISLCVTNEPKTIFTTSEIYSFLISPASDSKTVVRYNNIRYELGHEMKAPFESKQGNRWGALAYVYAPEKTKLIFDNIEARLKEGASEAQDK